MQSYPYNRATILQRVQIVYSFLVAKCKSDWILEPPEVITEYGGTLLQLLRLYHVLTAELYALCKKKQFAYFIKFCSIAVIKLSHFWDR